MYSKHGGTTRGRYGSGVVTKECVGIGDEREKYGANGIIA